MRVADTAGLVPISSLLIHSYSVRFVSVLHEPRLPWACLDLCVLTTSLRQLALHLLSEGSQALPHHQSEWH